LLNNLDNSDPLHYLLLCYTIVIGRMRYRDRYESHRGAHQLDHQAANNKKFARMNVYTISKTFLLHLLLALIRPDIVARSLGTVVAEDIVGNIGECHPRVDTGGITRGNKVLYIRQGDIQPASQFK